MTPRLRILALAVILVAVSFAPHAHAQTTDFRATASIDLTGYWVSIVSEDWRWRMVTPPRGDYASVPITAAAKVIADQWNPAADEASGNQCKSYGAAAIMRVPGRIHISWVDSNTLKVEMDAGTQTRLLHFGNWVAPRTEPDWQGSSVASWITPRAGQKAAPFGSLKVVTTRMKPGYLRKNGLPYSENAVMTEYWDIYKEQDGAQWLVITSILDDAMYLNTQWITSPNFKKESDGSKWNPTPCSARW